MVRLRAPGASPLALVLSSLLVLAACGDDDDDDDAVQPDAAADLDATSSADSSHGGDYDAAVDAGGPECPRVPGDPDRERWVVIAHPYDPEGAQSPAWEALRLGTDGTLERPGLTWQTGRALMGTVAFTPDGEVAVSVHEDGSLGVVSFAGAEPEVLQPQVTGDFYADAAVIDPAGDAVWILDPNWRNNGGGLYRAPIACDGTVGDATSIAPSKLLYGLVWIAADRAVAAAADLSVSALGDDLHLFDRTEDGVEIVAGSDAFGDDEAIVSALAVTADARWALVGDNSVFSEIPNRIAAVEIEGDTLRAAQIVDVEDPVAIVPSPFGDVVLVASGFGDALFTIDLDAGADEPLGTPRELEAVGAGPALPGSAVLVDRGANAGLVLVAENVAVRRVRFEQSGGATDLGPFGLGEGLEAIVGAIGVQP